MVLFQLDWRRPTILIRVKSRTCPLSLLSFGLQQPHTNLKQHYETCKQKYICVKIPRAPLILFISFWAIAIVLWQTRGNILYLFNFGYVGTFKMDIGGNEHIQRRNRLTRP